MSEIPLINYNESFGGIHYDHCVLYKDAQFKYKIHQDHVDLKLTKNGREYYLPLYKRGFWNEYIEIVARIDRLKWVWLNTSIPNSLKDRFPHYKKAASYNDDKYNRPEITYYDGLKETNKLAVVQRTKESYQALADSGKITETVCERIIKFLHNVMAIDREIDIMFELLYLKGYRFSAKSSSDIISTTRMIVLGIKIAKMFVGQSDGDNADFSMTDGSDINVLPPANNNPIPLDSLYLGNDIDFSTITDFDTTNNSRIGPLIGYSQNSSDIAISFTGNTDLEYAKSYEETAQRYADEAAEHLKKMEEAASEGDSGQCDLHKKWANEAKEKAVMFDGFAKRRIEWSKI